MRRTSPMVLLLALGLVASLGVNAWWVMHDHARPQPIADVPASPPPPERCVPASTSVPVAPTPATSPAPFELPRVLGTPPQPGAVVSPLTAELQQDLLSQLAREKLRDGWKAQEPAILSSLRASLDDPTQQRANAEREGRKLAALAGLDPASTQRFLDAYTAKRLPRAAAIQQALAPTPPDWNTALEQTRGVFAEEDALMESVGGDAALQRMRSAQAEGRTVILAIGASLANAPWEHAVHW